MAGCRPSPPRRLRAGDPRAQGGRRAGAPALGPVQRNAAWLLAATLAHDLLRWTARLGLGSHGEQLVAKTLRRTLLALPGRLTRSGRHWMLHLPAEWPWAHSFAMALARLRCIPYPT